MCAPRSLASLQNGPQPFHDHVGALLGRDGIELGVEGGQLHRHVGPGQRAPGRFVHLLDLRPLGRVLRQRLQQLQIAALVVVGLRLAQRRFAQHVDGEGEALLVEAFDDFAHFFGVGARDEGTGHLLHASAQRARRGPGAEPAHARHAQAGFHQAAERDRVCLRSTPLGGGRRLRDRPASAARPRSETAAGGCPVAHGPFEQLPRPPLGPEKRAGVFLHPLEQFPPDALRRSPPTLVGSAI